MSNAHAILQAARPARRKKPARGFSLVELMVAMSVFLIVGGAAVALVRRHAPLFNSAQNQAGLNITLRNAVAQLQMEVVNAGTGTPASTAFETTRRHDAWHRSQHKGVFVAAARSLASPSRSLDRRENEPSRPRRRASQEGERGAAW